MELFSAKSHFLLSTPSDFNYFCNVVQLPHCKTKYSASSLAWSEILFFQPVLVQSTTFLLHPSLLSVPSARRRFTADKHKPAFAAHLFSCPSVRPAWRLSSCRCSIKKGSCSFQYAFLWSSPLRRHLLPGSARAALLFKHRRTYEQINASTC